MSAIASFRCAILPEKEEVRPPHYRYGRFEAFDNPDQTFVPTAVAPQKTRCQRKRVSVAFPPEVGRGSHSTNGGHTSCRLGAGVVRTWPRRSKSLPCQCPHWMDTCTCVPQTPPEHGVLCKMLHLEYICEANIPEDTLTHTQLTTTLNADNCALSEPLRGTIMLRLMGNDP